MIIYPQKLLGSKNQTGSYLLLQSKNGAKKQYNETKNAFFLNEHFLTA